MEAHPCLTITCTLCAQVTAFNEVFSNLARLCASKSANGPRSNSFRPDSPSTTTCPRGRKTQAKIFPAPDMVRSGR